MTRRSRIGAILIEFAVVALAAVHLWSLLFAAPPIGMADNGDFERIFPDVGLAHVSTDPAHKYFLYFNPAYRIVPRTPNPDSYRTVTTGVAQIARALSMLAGRREVFDIRILASLHIAILLSGVWVLMRLTRPLPPLARLIFGGVLVAMLTDVGYAAYFNSFYSEATAFCFLIAAIGCGAVVARRPRGAAIAWLGFFIASAMVVTSKPMYVPLAPALAIFGVALARYLPQAQRYRLAALLAGALCALGAWYFTLVPGHMAAENTFMTVFMDLVPNSRTPEADLVALGLDPAFAGFTGLSSYQSDSPLRVPAVSTAMAPINAWTLTRFYLARPARFYDLCRRGMSWAFSTRVQRSGYFVAATGRVKESPIGFWSRVRETIFPRTVWFLGVFLLTGIVALAGLRRAGTDMRRYLSMLYVLLVFVAVVQFLVPLIASGEPDLEKHLFMFDVAFDGCLLLITLQVLQSRFVSPMLSRDYWLGPAPVVP